jgi:glyoxylase-like metal-dependent hydrolase (beta-lactamase superfamily II)
MWTFEGRRKSRVEESKAGVVDALTLVPSLPSTVYCLLLSAFCLLLSADSLLPTAYSRPPARGLYEVREVKPGVFVWVPEDVLDLEGDPQFNRPGTAGFIIATDGVVVVNTTNSPFHARELLYEIRQRTDLPVRYVINTDAEPDQMLGNEAFVDQGATIISSSQAQAAMRRYRHDLARRLDEDENWRLQGRMRGIHPTLPNQVFDEEMSLRLGGQEIRIRRVADGGSSGDAVVYLPAQKVLFLGRLFANGYFPRLASTDVRRWIEVLRDLESWDVDLYVPGHGPPGDKKQLAEFRGYLEWLVEEVQSRLEQGKTLAEIRREVNPLENYHWSARDLGMRAVEEVYQQLVAQRPSAGPGSLPAAAPAARP